MSDILVSRGEKPWYNKHAMTLEEKLKNLPDEPGVYMMKDARGHIIYIGKALSLVARVNSYFQKGPKGEKTELMMRQIADLETIVTHTELEALILESNLIKKHHPRYNIILRDDKNYPYLRFDIKSEYPRLEVVRRLKKDGALYYGPYVPAGGMWESLALIRRTFPLASCRKELGKKPERACVQFQIGRCLGPCTGDVDKAAYRDVVSQVRLFLEGKNRDLLDMLKRRMEEASEKMEYERAAELRDRISKIEGAFEKQKVISPGFENQDVVGIASEAGRADIQVLFIRNGMMLGRKDFYLDDVRGLPDEDILGDFLRQFYAKEMIVPAEVLLPREVPDREVFERWLSEKREAKVDLMVPQRGRKRELAQMASDNAAQSLREHTLSRRSKEKILMRLQEELGLRNLPRRIEAFDISQIQGTEPVASMVSFENNLPDKRHYRRFKIKTVAGQDDFASMAEVIRRRYTKAKEEGMLPDLILIDGGKGQLNATLDALKELQIEEPDVIGLAKARSGDEGTEREFERVFLPGVEEPIILDPSSATTHLVARARDEAHRFAITYHRKLREKRAVHSELDDIPGIGEARRKALLRHFGSVERIKQATVEDLAAVVGMTAKAAEKIVEFYGKERAESG
ncbi:MAG TPA: excinuclease ABC subunit UvrC [Nitrospirota bacterium]|nr:excinuclease ABC subunit UvrC [Nitrospirota bacterium]